MIDGALWFRYTWLELRGGVVDILNYWVSKQTEIKSKDLSDKLEADTGLPVHNSNFRAWVCGKKPLPNRVHRALIRIVIPFILVDIKASRANPDWMIEVLLPIDVDYRD